MDSNGVKYGFMFGKIIVLFFLVRWWEMIVRMFVLWVWVFFKLFWVNLVVWFWVMILIIGVFFLIRVIVLCLSFLEVKFFVWM